MKSSETSKLNEESNEGDEPKYNLIFGIEPNKKNIFCFDKSTKAISKIDLTFQGLQIDKFLCYLNC